MITSGLLADFPHGFSTREPVDFAALHPDTVLRMAKQVHGTRVVGPDDWSETPPEADAVTTGRRGYLVGVVTADCAPVLFGDPVAQVIAAAHAGWRGAVGGVIENTVAAMAAQGCERRNIRAVIGPTIARASYEVDAAMRDQFPMDAHRFFVPGAEGRWQFDLPGFVAARLQAAGVGAVEDLVEDTYAQPDRFHSFRRATHRGEPTGGRQTSVIALA